MVAEEKEKQVEDKDDEEDNEEGVDGDINAKIGPCTRRFCRSQQHPRMRTLSNDDELQQWGRRV